MSLFSKKSKDQPPPPPEPPRPAASAAQRPAPAAGPKPNGAAPKAQPAASSPPSAADIEAIKKGVERSRRTLVALGEVVSVLMKSPEYRAMNLATVQAVVAPAIASGQYLVLTAHQKERGAAVPVAVAMWASVSDEVDRRLSQSPDQAQAMTPADWTSGKIAWLTVVAGDQRAVPALLNRLQQTTLKGRVVKYRLKTADGKSEIKTLAAAPAGKQPAKP